MQVRGVDVRAHAVVHVGLFLCQEIGKRLQPFFDDVAVAGEDPAPPAPPLDALDHGVLDVCGDWGSRPRARDFRAMLDRPEVHDEVQQIYAALGRSVLMRATSRSCVPDSRFTGGPCSMADMGAPIG